MRLRLESIRSTFIAFGIFLSANAAAVDPPLPATDAYVAYDDDGVGVKRGEASAFSDDIDPFTGNLRTVNRLFTLPGNGGLDLSVLWVHNGQRPEQGGIHFGRLRNVASDGRCFNFSSFCDVVFELPDGTISRLFPIAGTGGINRYRSENNWWFEVSGNGYIGHAPDGVTYVFGRSFSRDVSRFVYTRSWSPPNSSYSPPVQSFTYAYAAVTSITDRNGNTLSFSYDGSGRPLSAVASDGRAASFGWGNPATISAHGRTWRIESAFGTETLVLPNGQTWAYRFNTSFGFDPLTGQIISITNPYGGTNSYSYAYVDVLDQFRAEEGQCRDAACTQLYTDRKREANRPVVYRKTTSDGSTWTFQHFVRGPNSVYVNSPDNQAADLSAPTSRAVTQPDGTSIGYTYYSIYNLPKGDFAGTTPGDYWKLGRLLQRQIGSQQTEIYTWSATGVAIPFSVQAPIAILAKLQTVRDGASYTTTTSYDGYLRPTTVVESGQASRTTTYTYAPVVNWQLNLVAEKRVSNGTETLVTTRRFDGNGNVLEQTANGVTTGFTYYANGDLASATNARGVVTSYDLYYRGVPRTEVRAAGRPEAIALSREVDNFGNVVMLTDGRGNITRYGFDALDRLTAVTPPLGNPTTLVWEPNRRTLTRGNYTEQTTFDGFSRPLSQRKHDSTVTMQYDLVGRKVFQSYPNQSIGDRFGYDALGRLIRLTHSDGSFSTLSYTANTVAVQNERGYTTTQRFIAYGDPDDKVLTEIVPASAEARTAIERNLAGQPLRVTQNGISRSYQYDSRFFLAAKTDPETGTTTFERDAVGNLLRRKVGTSPAIDYEYDGLNHLTRTVYADGLAQNVAYQYDKSGNLIHLENGTTLRDYDYDANNNVTREILSAGGDALALGYQYNGNDAVSTLTYPDGRRIDYAPDAKGRPTQLANFLTGIGYNARGQLTGHHGANGRVTTLTYTERGFPATQYVLLENQTLPRAPIAPIAPTPPGPAPGAPPYGEPGAGMSANTACRALYEEPRPPICNSQCGSAYSDYVAAHARWQANMNSCTGSWNARGSYWSNGQAGCHALIPPPTSANCQGCGSVYQTAINNCVSDWQPKATAWTNYRAAVANYNQQVAAYNAAKARYDQDYAAYLQAYAQWQIDYQNAVNAFQPAIASHYTYDPIGNLTAIDDRYSEVHDRTLSYDPLDRLITATGPWGSGRMNYDGNGNLTYQQYGSYALSYQYDVNQRLTGTTGSQALELAYDSYGNVTSKGTGKHFKYDSAGNMRFMNQGEASQIGYGYDGTGVRVLVQDGSRNVLELSDNNGNILYEVDRQTGIQKSHLYLNGKQLVEIKVNGTATVATWYHNDLIGGPLAASDVNGTVLWRAHYKPYGEKTKDGGPTDNQQWFAGKPQEEASGLSYFGARWYDPSLGRFAAVDPVGTNENNIHSFNRYAYANNNPYRYVDPDGRQGWDTLGMADNAPIVVTGKAFGALAAYVTGLATGDTALTNVAMEGMQESRDLNIETVGLMATVGRGGRAPSIKGQRGVELSIQAETAAGSKIIGKEVTIKTPEGRTRVDLVVERSDGCLVCIEAKNGPQARVNPNQKKNFEKINEGKGEPVGGNAESAGVTGKGSSMSVEVQHHNSGEP